MQKIRLFALNLFLLLTACGYHLRGSYDLPAAMRNIYLQGGSPLLQAQLAEVLYASSGEVVRSIDKADLVLRIYDEAIERRTLSLSQRGRSNDLELAGRLEYEVLDANGKTIVSREPVVFKREYFNDQQDVIAKDNEETVIRKEMYQQVVNQIMNRTRTAFAAKGK